MLPVLGDGHQPNTRASYTLWKGRITIPPPKNVTFAPRTYEKLSCGLNPQAWIVEKTMQSCFNRDPCNSLS